MKAISCQLPGQLAPVDKPYPELPNGGAIVKLKRMGICGTDYHAYEGNQPLLTYPRVLGHELSGDIQEIGSNPYGLNEGDQVTIVPYLECGECPACRDGKSNCCERLRVLGVHEDGGMQEYIALPADHLIATNDLSPDEATVVECFSIGAHAVRRAMLKPETTVLVIGAGPIGLGVMKFAALAGARVVAMDVNEARLAHARSWVSLYDAMAGGDDAGTRLRTLLRGRLPDCVFDATGNRASMERVFGLTAYGGTIVYVGLVKGSILLDDPLFHRRELTLLSSRNAAREDFMRVIRAIREHDVDVSQFITHRIGFDRVAAEFDRLLKAQSGIVKAIIDMA